MVAKTVYVILLVFVFLVVIVPLLLNALGVPVGTVGGDKSFTSSRSGNKAIAGSLLRSSDGGQQWHPVEWNRDNRPALPSAILDIAFHPTNSDVIFAGTAGSGLWKSVDAGAVWRKMTDANHALGDQADVYKIAISRAKPEIIYLAVADGDRGKTLRSDDGGASWREIYAVTRAGIAVFDVYTAPPSADRVSIATGDGRLLASDDGGRRWRIAHTQGAPIVTLAVNPAFSGEQYLITALGTIAKTFDGGSTWINLDAPTEERGAQSAPSGQITHPYSNWRLTFSRRAPSFSFAIDPQNPATLYFTRNDALFVSSNGGFSWRKMTALITGEGMALGSVAAHPARSGVIFVTAGEELYQSADNGMSWSIRTVAAGSSLQKVFAHPRRPEIIFVTTGR